MVFFTSIYQHMFGDKVFQTMIFSRHVQEASHCYENFGLEWSFKYSKNTMVSSKPWHSKEIFFTCLPNTSLEKIPWYSSIPWFCLKNLKIFCSQTPSKGLFGSKVFECHDITMVYHGIFYINPPTHV
jgi:hypothetical protein